mgnify:CR=1 FL=1
MTSLLNCPVMIRFAVLVAAIGMVVGSGLTPPPAHAQTLRNAEDLLVVDCLLPGQIHSVNGQATLGARRSIQTTPSDCRERGGEYTVDEHASQPMHVPHVPVAPSDDDRIVHCLLPRQLRRLGEKARYVTARRPIRTTRADCAVRDGDVISAVQARRAERDYLAATRPRPAPKKQP